MRFFAGLLGIYLLVALSNANVAQRRNYRNTAEILVPVTIIQDGEEIQEPANFQTIEKATELKNFQPEQIAENVVAAAVEAEQKLEAVEAVVQAQRRIDEAIVEEEINEAIKEEQAKEQEQVQEQLDKLKTTIAEVVDVALVQEPVEPESLAIKSAAITASQSPEQVIAAVADSEHTDNVINSEQQPADGLVRQATQATPTQSTTQQNFVQQLIQNSPLGQFFNQISGQTTQSQVASDNPTSAPVPALPGIFNPVAAVQNAAQTVANTTTQAFQGLQQFASNLGTQFQSTLSSLGGQPPAEGASDATTARPPGPIQQLVNAFIPAPTQQGPLQGFLSIFQGNNRPQQSTAAAAANTASATAADTARPDAQPTKETEIEKETEAPEAAATADETINEVRDSGEANDSFEESVKPEELIIVNDDATQTENDAEQEVTNN